MLTQAQIAVIKQTIPVLEEHGTHITGTFYHNMFQAHPELLNVFNKTNQAQGRQKTALAMTVLAAAKHIENLGALLPQVNQIGHKHRALNIKAEHYPIVGKYLLEAIKEVLGDAATEDIIDAWAAAYQVIADVFIQVEQAMYDEAAWADFIPFKVQDKQLMGADICHFTVTPVDNAFDLAKLELQAGQYITVKTTPEHSETDALRHYSLCSATTDKGLEFAVRRDNSNGHQGLVSNYLHDSVHIGDEVSLSAPAGDFLLDKTLLAQSDIPLVLLSAGVGMTPMVAMLEQQVQHNPARPIVWVYACANAAHQPFQAQVDALFQEAKAVEKHIFYSEAKQRIDEAFLLTLPKPADIYICGSMKFMESMIEHLVVLEHRQDHVHYEPFGPKMSLQS